MSGRQGTKACTPANSSALLEASGARLSVSLAARARHHGSCPSAKHRCEGQESPACPVLPPPWAFRLLQGASEGCWLNKGLRNTSGQEKCGFAGMQTDWIRWELSKQEQKQLTSTQSYSKVTGISGRQNSHDSISSHEFIAD